ncbi:uncharacterized protein [Clytia hemisphaerica]|uniref:uncharacterized protein isoform X2 n=1 Tax=Clytia hemisphaerica TaxID=252671 RepID=UPI0034D584D3
MNCWTSVIFLLVLLTTLVEGFTEPKKNKHEVVLFWGQNTARLPEKDLSYFCETGKYDTIVISYITEFFANQITRYPGMNLAVHCWKLPSKAYPNLFNCPNLGKAIATCKKKGIKILLGIRGERGNKWLTSKQDAEDFANRIWDLFLGGDKSPRLRPFGTVKLDGINLNIRIGDDKYYDTMLDKFNELFAEDRSQHYQITASPQCGLPLSDFKTSLDSRAKFIDAVYIRHDYGVDCHPGGSDFDENLEQWTKKIRYWNGKTFKNTKFYLVLVLSLELKYYMTLWKNFKPIYEQTLKNINEFGGIALEDAGWDDYSNPAEEKERYSTLVWHLFNPKGPEPWQPKVTTTSTTTKAPLNLKVGALWGSNIAEGTTGNTEPSLRVVCEKNLYDTVIINTLSDDANDQNKGNLPGLNFAKHCHTPFGPGYQNYLRCNTMGSDIQFCQDKGVKFLLNIGGSTRFIGFASKNESQTFAHNLWLLFLGGTTEAAEKSLPRTFGRVVLDGVNIEVRFGQGAYFVNFVQELREIMDKKGEGREYMITANPSCVHPSYILDESFSKAITSFDHLYVNFDDEQCHINKPSGFESAFQVWYDYAVRNGGPKIWVGLPSDPRNTRTSEHYLKRVNAKNKLENLAKNYLKFG